MAAHRNIVSILDHGKFDDWTRDYFIDMELCDGTLRNYIDYHYHKTSIEPTPVSFNSIPAFPPIFVQRDCDLLMRLRNMWAIGVHMASGLEFLHVHNLVHRDLNPCNGTSFA